MRKIGFRMTVGGEVIRPCHGIDAYDQSIRVRGKVWRFDYDMFFGPLWIGKNGRQTKSQNRPKDVWRALKRWENRMARKLQSQAV